MCCTRPKEAMTKTWKVLDNFQLLLLFLSVTDGVRHARNLIWTQTPSMKMGMSRIVGIQGDPSEWVPSGNVQVRHITAPHVGWQFKALAFNYAAQTLYWSESTNKKIQGLPLNGSIDTTTIFSGTSNMAEGMAVDWISNNIYWADSVYNWIVMAPLGSTEHVTKVVVKTDLSSPHSVVTHPAKGYLFWTDIGEQSKIECSDLLGDNRRTIIDTDIQHPRGITIDYAEDRLYWVDSKLDTIETALLSGADRRVVAYQSSTIFFGIAAYQNYVFVTEQLQGHLRVYDKKSGHNIINYQLGYTPDGIIMYAEDLQEGNSSACMMMGCHQICIHDPLVGPMCRCGEGFLLNADGVSCQSDKKFASPSHIYAIRDAICQYPANMADMSLVNVTLQSQCFLQNGRGYLGLTYDISEHVLYYSENVTRSIGRMNLEVDAAAETIIKGVGEVPALALDWVTGNLFWTDRTYNHISMAKKDGMYPIVVISNLSEPLGLAVHPLRGELYWSEHGNKQMIYAASMDGSNQRPLVNLTAAEMPNHLYLDINNNVLYWADSGLFSIRKVNLDTGEVEIVYENVKQLVKFFGVSIYQDYVLWTDSQDTRNGIHAANLDRQEKVRGILHPHVGLASELVTFDPINQPQLNSACSDPSFCEHLCIPTGESSQVCACGIGYTLDETLRTCSTRVMRDHFVLAVDSYQRQIFQISLKNDDVSAIPLANKYKGVAMDIDPMSLSIFWTDNKATAIMKSAIDGYGESVFRKLPNDSISDGIAVDYVNQLLFYTCTNYDIIVVTSLFNPTLYKTIVNESLDEPRDIIVHPEEGKIYWTDWGLEPKIESATMDGGNRSLILKLDNNSWPNAIALDPKRMNLFWVDARADVVGRINLLTSEKSIVYAEEKAHFFGLALLGDYLYVTDWFRKHVSRLHVNGSSLEQVGPSKFARLNGIVAYHQADVRISRSICGSCSHLCLPVSSTNYRCACADDPEGVNSPCREINEINWKISNARFRKQSNKDESPAVAIGMSILGVVAVLVIAVASVYIYNRRCRNNIPHDKLVEDTSRVDTFYRITFPDPTKDEANFDSGIDNPSFHCSSEDVQSTHNLVKYSPM